MIKLYWVEDHPDLSGKAMMGTSEDVSISGVRFRCPQQIQPNVRLSLCVVMTEPHGFFPMRGVVQWVNRAPDSEDWVMGVEFDAKKLEMDGWTAFIHDIERRAALAQEE